MKKYIKFKEPKVDFELFSSHSEFINRYNLFFDSISRENLDYFNKDFMQTRLEMKSDKLFKRREFMLTIIVGIGCFIIGAIVGRRAPEIMNWLSGWFS